MQFGAQLQLCRSCKSGLRFLSLSSVHKAAINYYDLLGVKPDASLEQIKNAFFDKSKKMHPDSDLSNPGLHGQFVELSEAYRVLSKEVSRKEYDLRLQRPYTSRPTTAYSPSQAQESVRYWEQFRQSPAQESSAEEWERKKTRNFRIVSYCILIMGLSVGAHIVFFRKLESVHNNFMDKKDRIITQIYNESKERARTNGFKKQTEILRQKHAEFLEKYKVPRNSGADK
ncbi:dnaJ homolog subfamily C member 4 isoform X2 [Esox lucius]|uniref:J domain-containing protein n=1 Tax=Esox lucius TaxID=8010 RepID=A0A3P8XSH8_ESOLU|nr:dnaJ homolog subfamily C member 4 isoform X2 [Esox lucius]